MNQASGATGEAVALAICIPARDEAARLPRLFAALDGLLVPTRATVAICLLLDSCSDDSAAVAADYAGRARHPLHVAVRRGGDANAGIARHAAMMLGMAAVDADGILLSTDADSWPRADWLLATVAALDRADVVAGDVLRRDRRPDPRQDRVDGYFARLHMLRRRVDPVAWEAPATHHHASGANIALRAETYAALGGFAPVPSGEDARLVDDAARAGFRVRRDAASVVDTSARRHGRAQGGLASALDRLDRNGIDAVQVTHPADQLWQYRQQASARRAFAAGDVATLSEGLRLTPEHLRGVARDCPNGEAFAMRVVPEAPGGMRQVPLTVAEGVLAAEIDTTTPARAA